MECLLFACAAYYLPQNAGAIARKHIKDPQLLSFIDAEVTQITLSSESASHCCALTWIIFWTDHKIWLSASVFHCQYC